MPDRRFIGFSDPFTPQQHDKLREAFIAVAKKYDGAAKFDEYWPTIQRKAWLCRQQLGVQRYAGIRDGKRRTDPNRFRTMKRIAAGGKAKRINVWELIDGAERAGVINQFVPDWQNDRTTLEQAVDLLCRLTQEQAQAAAKGALLEGSLFRQITDGRRQRPTQAALLAYVQFLEEIYRGIRGASLRSTYLKWDEDEQRSGIFRSRRAGPAITFATAALAPVYPAPSHTRPQPRPTTHGIARLIERALAK